MGDLGGVTYDRVDFSAIFEMRIRAAPFQRRADAQEKRI